MLETIDLSGKILKEEYKLLITKLEQRLGPLQREAKALKIPVVIVFDGWDASGKGTLINKFIQLLDPRGINVYEIKAPSEEENMKPLFWRFWKRTPEKGRIAVFDRGWYKEIFNLKSKKHEKRKALNKLYTEINSFEGQLTADGHIIIKIFLHISKKEQKKRFSELQENDATSWRVSEEDWKRHKKYEQLMKVYEEMFEKTDSNVAAWKIVEAQDKNYATIKALTIITEALENKINYVKNKADENELLKQKPEIEIISKSFLDDIDLTKTKTEQEYILNLSKYQKRLREIEYEMYKKRIPLIVLYEGCDASGKGGNIKRLTQSLDPRGYEIVPIAAPNDLEKEHHYLWRFWNSIPKAGHITIFDRTWYGRVLVERVEKFCSEADWKRAYEEINEMEEQFADFGAVLVKFWLHIDKEEQLKRFEERQRLEYKNWKITDEDWRNREKWDKYISAVDEMLLRTSTSYAPWTVVESNCKYYARIKTLKTVIEAMEKKL
jgi:AMP-polyphosphate phosphotransferase